MNVAKAACAAAIAVASIAAAVPAQAASARPLGAGRIGHTVKAQPVTRYIAHRGGAAEHPEGSMPAYRAAAAAGFPLEMDVRTLRDGTLVLMHDGTVDRTTNGHGAPESMTIAQWRRLRIDHGGGVPPTFTQILDEFGGRVLLVPEPKDSRATARMIAAIRAQGLQGSVLAQSFALADVAATAKAGIPSMLLVGTLDKSRVNRMKAAGVRYVGLRAGDRDTLSEVRLARRSGLVVSAWTVDNRAQVRRLFAAGVWSVFTNDPWKVRR